MPTDNDDSQSKVRLSDGPHTTPRFLRSGVPFLSVDNIQNGELVFKNCRYISAEDHAEFSKKTAPRHGDILLAKAASTGKIARVKVTFPFSVWSPLALIRTNPGDTLPAFLEYALKDVAAQAQVETLCTLSTQKNISMGDIPKLRLAFPPLSEQGTIVRFLDHIERRIRRYIRSKERLIELLEEQKQAIIHQAVTGQIDVRTGQPYPAYTDSGVEWLGKVPEHWEIVRLKDVAQVQTGLTLGKDYRGTRTTARPYLRVANVQSGCLDLTHVKSIDVPLDEADRATLFTDDVLMTEGGDIDKLGRGCVWRGEIPGCLHQNHIFAVRCRRRLLSPEFLVGLMGSRHGRTYFELTAKQTTNLASTNSRTLRAFPVLLPILEEQMAIVNAISAGMNLLDNAMGHAQRQINLVREYRTRLIADVVTGKFDVREAAAAMPEELDAPTDAMGTIDLENATERHEEEVAR